MKKPELQDFGIPPEVYARFQKLGPIPPENSERRETVQGSALLLELVLATCALIGGVTLATKQMWGLSALLIAVSVGLFLAAVWLIVNLISEDNRRRARQLIERSPIVAKIKKYEDSLAANTKLQKEVEKNRLEAKIAKARREQVERKRSIEYWRSLRGFQFERALAELYISLGYDVQFTPTSGDQGIDLVLMKGDQITIVQCKGQKSPTTPAIARDLFGSFHAFPGCHRAILACTGGFTQGVRAFARGKPITLISASDLAKMTADADSFDIPQSTGKLAGIRNTDPRKCDTCGSRMKLRSGSYGTFWGCSNYPRCRFTRKYN